MRAHCVIRAGRLFYAQGPTARWYSNDQFATHFKTQDDAHTEARVVLRLDPSDYELDPCYPIHPRLPNGGHTYAPRPQH